MSVGGVRLIQKLFVISSWCCRLSGSSKSYFLTLWWLLLTSAHNSLIFINIYFRLGRILFFCFFTIPISGNLSPRFSDQTNQAHNHSIIIPTSSPAFPEPYSKDALLHIPPLALRRPLLLCSRGDAPRGHLAHLVRLSLHPARRDEDGSGRAHQDSVDHHNDDKHRRRRLPRLRDTGDRPTDRACDAADRGSWRSGVER